MKYIVLFSLLLSSCIPFDDKDVSVCTNRCFTIEGTVLNSATKVPMQNLRIRGAFIEGFLFTADHTKAEAFTDVNGFYSMSFEVFNNEIDGGGDFSIRMDKSRRVFWPSSTIKMLEIPNSDYDFENTYVADFLIPEPATLKYDMDCLSHLKDGETANFSVSYSFEAIDKMISKEINLDFDKDTKEDDGTISVPAGVPLSIEATRHTPSGTTVLEKSTITLELNQKFKVEVDI